MKFLYNNYLGCQIKKVSASYSPGMQCQTYFPSLNHSLLPLKYRPMCVEMHWFKRSPFRWLRATPTPRANWKANSIVSLLKKLVRSLEKKWRHLRQAKSVGHRIRHTQKKANKSSSCISTNKEALSALQSSTRRSNPTANLTQGESRASSRSWHKSRGSPSVAATLNKIIRQKALILWSRRYWT